MVDPGSELKRGEVLSLSSILSIDLESDRGPTILFSCTLTSNSGTPLGPMSSIVGWNLLNASAIFL